MPASRLQASDYKESVRAQVLPHDRHRLLQRRPPPRPRAREGRRRLHRPLPPPARGRRPLPDGHGRALAGGAAGGRAERARAEGVGGPDGRDVRGATGAASSAATTTGSAPPSRGITGATTALLEQIAAREPGRPVRGRVRGALLLRLRGVQAAGADRERALHRAPDARAGADQGAEPLLPAEPLPRPPARADPVGRVPGRAGHPAERDRPTAGGRACRTSR